MLVGFALALSHNNESSMAEGMTDTSNGDLLSSVFAIHTEMCKVPARSGV
jgi:hypothetical protein